MKPSKIRICSQNNMELPRRHRAAVSMRKTCVSYLCAVELNALFSILYNMIRVCSRSIGHRLSSVVMKWNTTYFSTCRSHRRVFSALSAASRTKPQVPSGVLRATPESRAEWPIIRAKLTGSQLQLSTLSDDELKRKMDEFNDLFVTVCVFT